jgi:hypothetical protein
LFDQEKMGMSTSFTLNYVSNYIWIQHPADYEITPDSQQQLWLAIGEACEKYRCWRVLAESSAPPQRNMSTQDALKSAGQAAIASSELRVACVFPGYITDETTEFFITVAYNRGVRIEFFTNRQEALNWLGVDQAELLDLT